jgi:predicted histone-like DNA-binding protein
MAIICEKREMVLGFMEEKPTVHVISPVRQQQVTFDKLLDETSSSCGVSRAQAKASTEALIDRMILFMEYGMSVRLGDFGSFRPTVNVKSQKNKEDLGADNVVRRKIIFTPGKRFKTMLNNLSINTIDDEKEVSESNTGGHLPEGGDTGNGGESLDPNA